MIPDLARILLVEDDPDIEAVVSFALGAAGFTLHSCRSGPEAVRAVSGFHPDLVLLDAMMPGMDGLSTFCALRTLPETVATPVVFMTARVQPHEVEEYRRAGAADVVTKPFEPTALAGILAGIWHRIHAPREDPPAAFEAIRQQYVADLPQRVTALGAAVRQARDGAPAAVAEVFQLAHRLVGSSGIYGLPHVSEAARALETGAQQVAGGQPGPDLAALFAAVEAASLRPAP